MAASDIADSTDWLSTSIPLLAPFESSLRCQVCKDLFNTPMITSCAHTFCSLCIRRCLENDGRCPTCREQDQPSKLRKNGTVQNIVDLFQEARSQTLDVARRYKDLEDQWRAGASKGEATSGRKRKWVDSDGPEGVNSSQKSLRQTRSQSKRNVEPITSQNSDVSEDGFDGGVQYGGHVSRGDLTTDAERVSDGLVACPMCNSRMKEEAIWAHLDKCDGTPQRSSSSSRSATSNSKPYVRPPLPTHNVDRLPQPNFRLLKDVQLKKKMSDFGVPVWGDRLLLQRRYTEWVNLYNANADSSRPRTTRELLKDLDTWERSQGGRATQREAKTKEKDFDGNAWARDNKDQFADLIAQARAKRKVAPQVDEEGHERDQEPDMQESEPQITGPQMTQDMQTSDSVVVRSSSSTVTASADPIMAEALQGQPKNGNTTDVPPYREGTESIQSTVHLPPSHTTPLKPPQPPDRGLPGSADEVAEPPLHRRPMFVNPGAGFTDGDGIETSGE